MRPSIGYSGLECYDIFEFEVVAYEEEPTMTPGQIEKIDYKGYMTTLEFFEGKSYIIKILDRNLSKKKYHSFKTPGEARRGFCRLVDQYLDKKTKNAFAGSTR